MARKYTRKTNRGQTPIDVLKRAAGALRQSGKLRQSAREFNVSKTTLKRFVDQYGPFKTAFGVAMDGWMRSHPGRIVIIYDVPSLVAEAQLYSLTIFGIFRMASLSRVYIHRTEMSSQMRILRQPKSLIAQIWGLSIVQVTCMTNKILESKIYQIRMN